MTRAIRHRLPRRAADGLRSPAHRGVPRQDLSLPPWTFDPCTTFPLDLLWRAGPDELPRPAVAAFAGIATEVTEREGWLVALPTLDQA